MGMFDTVSNVAGGVWNSLTHPQANAGGSGAGPVAGPSSAPAEKKEDSFLGGITQTIGDIGRGFSQEGLGGLLDPFGMMDRQKAQRELADRFQVMKPEDMVCKPGEPDKYAPNQVSQEEFEKIARTYSDVRMGRSDVKFDKSADDKYKQGTMEDIARLMQTESGRELMYKMSNNTAGEKDKDGNPVHHTTTLKPFLKPDGTPDTTNSEEQGVDKSGNNLPISTPNAVNGQGIDSVVRYNPGATVDPGKSNPWWPARSDVIFMHEMTHAYHDTQGTTDAGQTDNTTGDGVPGQIGNQVGRWEHQAAGLGKYKDNSISENKYRAERAQLGANGTTGVLPGDVGMKHRDYYD